MRKTFKYRLYPTSSQSKCLEETFGLCRILYNCALEERISYYKKYNKTLSYNKQAIELPACKIEIPELVSVYSQVLQSTLKRVDSAYQNFFRRLKNGEAKSGFPRFKSQDRFRSVLYSQKGFALGKRKGHKNSKKRILRLSKIGNVPMFEHRNIQGIIKTLSIVRNSCGQWFACFSCDMVPQAPVTKTGKSIGIDLGVKNLVTLSNGDKIPNPKHYNNAKYKLAAAQQRLSKLSFKDSRRPASKLSAARLYNKIVNQREDFQHKLSNNLIKEFDKIYMEDLCIKNMQKDNSNILNQDIQNCGWNQLVQKLLYKAESAGKEVVLVNPANTSKMCSGCGNMVIKTLSERMHRCDACGLEMDRDYNAAINIYNRGLACQSSQASLKDANRGKQSLPRESRNIFSETSKSP